MTCIVGYNASPTLTIMGCDTLATDGWTTYEIPTKMIKRDSLLMGFAGDSRPQNIMSLVPKDKFPALPAFPDLYGMYVGSLLVETIKDACRAARYLHTENEVESLPDENCSILVGLPGHLYLISSNFLVTPISRGYFAIGSGQQAALGALDVIKRLNERYAQSRKKDIRDMHILGVDAVELALGAAARQSVHVGYHTRTLNTGD